MKIQAKSFRLLKTLGILTVVGAISVQAIFQTSVQASQIETRSLLLQANGSNGGSAPGVAVNHLFTFTVPTAGNVGSVKIEYCTTAADVGAQTCQAPPSMSAATATLGSETGITGMSITSATQNVVTLTRSPATAVSANTVVTYQLVGVVNPSALKADMVTPEPNYTFFARISTYASTDASGTAVDRGTVAASTADPVHLTGTMPESLVFCTGATVPFKLGPDLVTYTTIPDCANATSAADIRFNQLFDPISTASATSQMAASTNAGSGYVITVNGATLQSGENSISPIIVTAPSQPGTSQFGMNLKANSAGSLGVAVGAEVSPLPADSVVGGVTYRGQAINGYDVVDNYKYVSGDAVADSKNGYVPGPGATAATDGQIFTVTYMVNVPGSQPAGDYSTTLTYICTPTF